MRQPFSAQRIKLGTAKSKALPKFNACTNQNSIVMDEPITGVLVPD
jgi:hypothetical protein